jgi:hypothetical protein
MAALLYGPEMALIAVAGLLLGTLPLVGIDVELRPDS